MLDHIGIQVRDYALCKRFYAAVLAPLGYGVVMDLSAEMTGGYVGTGFGVQGKPSFWMSPVASATTSGSAVRTGAEVSSAAALHLAFVAATRAQVDAFYAAAMAAGARDNGKPGLRPHYHPNYYGAFVFDPDGNNIEAVCHAPA